MPLINRIEVANFLNSRSTPWQPIWPHSVFDLNGLNTVIILPNGKGKTTLVNLSLLCLAGKGKRINEIRSQHFAPKNSGHYTHVRFQFTMDTEEGASRDIFGTPQGQQMVFGIYGNSGDNEQYHLYAYHGTFEDCPVHKTCPGFKTRFELIPDQQFTDTFHNLPNRFPAIAKERSQEAWLLYVAKFFDMPSIEQQLNYQSKSGAEGDSNYFEVKPRQNMRYSAAVFYEHLAPQLLTNVMAGMGEEDEWSIEDTIHTRARQVVHARVHSDNVKKQLDQTEFVLNEFRRLDSLSTDMLEAKLELQGHESNLATELAFLKDIVADRPIPGLPSPLPEDLPPVARYLVTCDGVPFLPDRGFEVFTGEEPKRINERALRHGLKPAEVEKAQLIEITCDLKIMGRDDRGKPNRYYGKEAVMDLLRHTETFLPEFNRDTAIADIETSFAWATEHADTNPARLMKKQMETTRQMKKRKWDELSELAQELSREKINLIQEQQTIGEQQAEYRRMQESGLFTQEEIAEPAATGIAVRNAVQIADKEFRVHEQAVSRQAEVYSSYQQFIAEYGTTTTPDSVLRNLVNAEEAAKDARNKLKAQHDDLTGKRKEMLILAKRALENYRLLQGRLDEATFTREQSDRYVEIFGKEDPDGLETKVLGELKSCREAATNLEKDLSRLATAIEATQLFRAQFRGTDPAEWLAKRGRLREGIRQRHAQVDSRQQEIQTNLVNLEKFSLAPGKYARDVAREVGVPHRQLYTVVDGMSLATDKKEQVLTLFSALLFAPVVATMNEAVLAARNLAEKGIEFPVFVAEELLEFCEKGEISNHDNAARSLFVGVRTRSVDCLLDPSLVEREISMCKAEITALDRRLTILDKALHRLSHDTPSARLAGRARDAIESGAIDRDAVIKQKLEVVRTEFSRLESRADTRALEAIRCTIRHRRALAGLTYPELCEQTETAANESQLTEAQISTLDNMITTVSLDLEKATGKMTSASVAKARQEPLLGKIKAFIDNKEHGPSFMASAEKTSQQLSDILDKEKRREGFRFESAQQFLTSGSQRPLGIETRLAEITHKIPENESQRSTLHNEITAIEEPILSLQRSVDAIDSLAKNLLKLYRNHRHLIMPQQEGIDRHRLYTTCQFARNSESYEECIKRLGKLKVEVEDLNDTIADLGQIRSKSESRFKAARDFFTSNLERVANDERLKISSHVREKLLQAPENPNIVRALLNATQENYDTDRAANETALKELDREWEGLAGWLSEFTQRLPHYLKLMRSVFAPKYDQTSGAISHAGFEIGGEAVRFEDIQGILGDIIADIEEYESDRQRHRDKNVRKSIQESFRKEIREKFYQRVIVNPYIKVCMPSISRTPLPLEKKMVSSGQGVAMSLLWIVKLADFVAERERHRKTTWQLGSTARPTLKKLRSVESLFVFIDGAFSHLSDDRLIKDALNGVSNTHGRLQLIVTGHNPDYRHNFDYFPTYIWGRETGNRYMYVENQKPVEPGLVGSHYGAVELNRVKSVPKLKEGIN